MTEEEVKIAAKAIQWLEEYGDPEEIARMVITSLDASRDKELLALREALETSDAALNDWITTYAADFCDEEEVKKAWDRIRRGGGTLHYVSVIQQANRTALTSTSDTAAAIVERIRGEALEEAAKAIDREYVWNDEDRIHWQCATTIRALNAEQREGA